MSKKKIDTKSIPVVKPTKDNRLYTKDFNKAGSIDDPFIVRAVGSSSSVHQRSGYNRYDKDNSRLEDRIPTEHGDIILGCQSIYRRNGMVRNIVDLMADFASEGIELVHPVRAQQHFFQEWAKRVKLQDRVHDFMKNMLRDGNVIIHRKFGFLSKPARKQFVRAEDDIEIDKPERVTKDKKALNKWIIPWKYVFISPAICKKGGGTLARFYGDDTIVMTISPDLRRAISDPKSAADKELANKLPSDIIKAAKNKKGEVVLDPARTYVSYYKKDDWDDWGTPFLYSVLEDIMLKDKMRLADIAALDGIINVIRVWKLGKSDKQILPTKAAVSKLIGILQNNCGGGAMDIVWDDMIDLQVEYPPTDKILGDSKYKSVNTDIVRGLGVPDALLGGTDMATRNGQTAFVQLKTLVERLEYVRSKALEWLETELTLVTKAMGFKRMPTIRFGTMSLRDEAAEKALVIQLLDRGIISIETVLKVFGHDFVIELERLKEEQDLRDAAKPVLEKAGPYNRPFSVMDRQTDNAIRLEESKSGGTGGGDNPFGDQPKDDSISPKNGRPSNQPSTKPRDTRTPKTLSYVYENIAETFLDEIDKCVDPMFLSSKGIGNIRKASAAQRTELENIKWSILCCLSLTDRVTDETISAALAKTSDDTVVLIDKTYRQLYSEFMSIVSKQPTLPERRRLMSTAWAIHAIKRDGDEYN